MTRIGRLGELLCACAALASSIAAATAKPSTVLIRLILPSPYVAHRSSDAPLPLYRGNSVVGHQRADAARQAQHAWPAFTLNLFSVEAKRGNAAIDGKAVARRRAVQRRGDAKNLAPPFAERNRKAALLAKLDIRQRPRLHTVGFFRTLGLHISHIGVELFLGEQRQQRAADGGGRQRTGKADIRQMRHGIGG